MKKEAVSLLNTIQWISESLTYFLENCRPVLTPINQVPQSTREVGVGQNNSVFSSSRKPELRKDVRTLSGSFHTWYKRNCFTKINLKANRNT